MSSGNFYFKRQILKTPHPLFCNTSDLTSEDDRNLLESRADLSLTTKDNSFISLYSGRTKTLEESEKERKINKNFFVGAENSDLNNKFKSEIIKEKYQRVKNSNFTIFQNNGVKFPIYKNISENFINFEELKKKKNEFLKNNNFNCHPNISLTTPYLKNPNTPADLLISHNKSSLDNSNSCFNNTSDESQNNNNEYSISSFESNNNIKGTPSFGVSSNEQTEKKEENQNQSQQEEEEPKEPIHRLLPKCLKDNEDFKQILQFHFKDYKPNTDTHKFALIRKRKCKYFRIIS